MTPMRFPFPRLLDSGLAIILVTVGTIGLVVVSVPQLRWFLALALGCGAILAAVILVLQAREPSAPRQAHDEGLPTVQINISRVPISGSVAGLLVVVGSVSVLVVGLEEARWFFAAALASGILLAILLAGWHRRHPGRQVPENTLKP